MDDTSFSHSNEPREERGPRIPPAKIQGIAAEPTISIFYKPTRDSPVQLLDGKFSKDAAVVFCDRVRREIYEGNTKAFTITGGDLQGFKDVLAWIKDCIPEGKAVQFQTLDIESPGIFTRYAYAIEAASYLGIPARDFAEGVTKRLLSVARRVLMTWDEVEYFYEKHDDNGLREVAATSVFFAWWNGKLHEETTPEEMMFLDVLRKEIPALDEDLHECAAQNERQVREKWAEKDRLKHEQKEQAERGDSGLDEFNANGNGAQNGQWDATNGNSDIQGWTKRDTGKLWSGTGPVTIVGDWDKENLTSGKPPVINWSVSPTKDAFNDNSNVSSVSGDWADEVNDSQHHHEHPTPNIDW